MDGLNELVDKMKTYKGVITTLGPNQIFVFGSNTHGRHGKGSALIAFKKFGAIYGQAEGLQGRSFAIITKDLTCYKHPSRKPSQIIEQIGKLYEFAELNKDKEFFIVYKANSNNLNSYSPQSMATFFGALSIPSNIVFEDEFYKLIS